MSKPLFHEISDEKWEELIAAKTTWGDIMRDYAEPPWCDYGPDALEGEAGCWSLIGRKVTGEDFCKNCDGHKDNARRIWGGPQSPVR